MSSSQRYTATESFQSTEKFFYKSGYGIKKMVFILNLKKGCQNPAY